MSFTSRTFVSGAGSNGHNVCEDPTMKDLAENFGRSLTHILNRRTHYSIIRNYNLVLAFSHLLIFRQPANFQGSSIYVQ